MSDRVVLAYSGGLDTSVAISWIAKETGKEVVAVAIDLGQGGEDMEVVRQRALDCGAVESVVVDAKDEFADEYCLPTIQANALYMDRYPLVSAISRPLIVKHIVEAAREHGGFTEPQAWESLVRGWHLEGLAVRPEHRMHAHTGFLVSTRRLADGVAAPLVKRRPAKGTQGEDGAPASAPEPTPDEAWTPEAVGERPVSDKKMRKLVRSFENTPTAQALAADDAAADRDVETGAAPQDATDPVVTDQE